MSKEAIKLALKALKTAQNNLAPSKHLAHVYGDGELWDEYADAIKALKEALKQEQGEPNLFWNNDDPEMSYSSIAEFLNDEWCNVGLEAGDTRTVQQAIRLPNVVVRITSVSEDGDIDYIEEAAHGIKE